jgi:hypothetical protein
MASVRTLRYHIGIRQAAMVLMRLLGGSTLAGASPNGSIMRCNAAPLLVSAACHPRQVKEPSGSGTYRGLAEIWPVICISSVMMSISSRGTKDPAKAGTPNLL